MSKKILIAGGTGLIGKRLSELLIKKGYEVLLLSRTPQSNATISTYQWNLFQGTIDEEALHQVDYIINLAGANVADQRWSQRRKKILIDSRVYGAATFAKYIEEGLLQPKAYISASAIGIYGNTGEQMVTENASKGEGFLADCTEAWESAFSKIAKVNIRTVGLRIGIVFSSSGGALEKMLLPFKFRIANWFGNGKQYYSWIHIEDVCQMFIWALENENTNGFYNAVAPEAISNKELIQEIKKIKNKKYLSFPIPAFLLRLFLGQMADIILHGSKVSPQKIIQEGFQFQFSDLNKALKNLIQ